MIQNLNWNVISLSYGFSKSPNQTHLLFCYIEAELHVTIDMWLLQELPVKSQLQVLCGNSDLLCDLYAVPNVGTVPILNPVLENAVSSLMFWCTFSSGSGAWAHAWNWGQNTLPFTSFLTTLLSRPCWDLSFSMSSLVFVSSAFCFLIILP